jgi:hypothetical protein
MTGFSSLFCSPACFLFSVNVISPDFFFAHLVALPVVQAGSGRAEQDVTGKSDFPDPQLVSIVKCISLH